MEKPRKAPLNNLIGKVVALIVLIGLGLIVSGLITGCVALVWRWALKLIA